LVYSESYNQVDGASFLHGEAHSRHYNCSVTQKGIVLFLMAGVFWGLPYFFIALAIESFSTPSVVFARTLLGALVLIPYAALTGGLKPALKAWPYVLVFAVVEMVGPWFLITEAQKGIPSGLAGLLVATVPFFVVAILAIFLKDRKALRLRPLSGMVIGFAGVAALVGIDSFSGVIEPLFVLMVIGAALGYAVAPIVANIKLSDVPSAGVIGLSMAIVASLYAPFSVPNLGTEFASATVSSLWALVVLGLVCSAAAFVIFFRLIKEVGPAKASLITYLNTAVALTLGTIFLNEPVTTGLLIGLPMIAIGLYLSGGATAKEDIPDSAA
jgi:drug/metabolite transporter (DMT)-like permease